MRCMRSGRASARKPRAKISGYHGKLSVRAGAWLPLLLAAVFLALAAVCRLILPGVRFSACLFAALAAVCVGYAVLRRWAEQSKTGRICKAAFLACLCAFLLIFTLVEGKIVRAGRISGGLPDGSPPDAVIVLGAGVNGTTPSLALQSRIDAAETYLNGTLAGLPEVPVILSGGQGRGEEITEARCMYNVLTADGIAPERLHLEEKSTVTAENFRNSAALLRELGIDPDTAVVAYVTGNFHIYRAGLLAQDAGLWAFGVPARLPWRWLSANYYVREFFALGKLVLTRAMT